jgi:hypothetical protein
MDSPFMGDVLLLLGVVATRDARAIEGKPAHLSAVHVQVSDRPINVLWNVVARDGIEPPTPAFSGLPDNAAKWLGISGYV